MATRREVERRRNALIHELREAVRTGSLQAGETLPPMKELADKFEISVNVTHQAIQQLVDEGLLCTIPRVGTFVRRRSNHVEGFYLWLVEEGIPSKAQSGFELRMAQLGGATLALTPTQLEELFLKGQMPTLQGVFSSCASSSQETALKYLKNVGIPFVTFADRTEDTQEDTVGFDDVEAGKTAAEHLVQMGHRRVAFLAAHPNYAPFHPSLSWSKRREEGWRRGLEACDISAEGLAFHPLKSSCCSAESMQNIGHELAHAILHYHREISAVIAANDHVALGFMAALQNEGVPSSQWPAIVGFDNIPLSGAHLLSTFYVPWEQLGREAADLLWERRHGALTGPPIQRTVPLYLLPRLSSHRGWASIGVFEVINPSSFLQLALAK